MVWLCIKTDKLPREGTQAGRVPSPSWARQGISSNATIRRPKSTLNKKPTVSTVNVNYVRYQIKVGFISWQQEEWHKNWADPSACCEYWPLSWAALSIRTYQFGGPRDLLNDADFRILDGVCAGGRQNPPCPINTKELTYTLELCCSYNPGIWARFGWFTSTCQFPTLPA